MAGEVVVLERLVRRIAPGGKLLRSWPLRGGVSAEVTGIEIVAGDGTARKLVVRRHGGRDLAADPLIAEHEFRLLQALNRAGLPVPRPISYDQTRSILPSPFIVVEYIEGEADLAPADVQASVVQMADSLAAIHRVDLSELGFLHREETPETIPLPHPEVLLHGDYWPGNILWREGRLAAVIDWEDARIGDPLHDVANARLELRWALGRDAMRLFTERYGEVAATGFARLPHWDIAVAAQRRQRFANGDLIRRLSGECWTTPPVRH